MWAGGAEAEPLEDENWQLKRVVADQALNLQVLKDLMGHRL